MTGVHTGFELGGGGGVQVRVQTWRVCLQHILTCPRKCLVRDIWRHFVLLVGFQLALIKVSFCSSSCNQKGGKSGNEDGRRRTVGTPRTLMLPLDHSRP